MASAVISSETRKSIIGAVWLTALPILLSAIALPATVYVIRSLGPTGYGEWSIATSLVGAVTALSTLGLSPILTRKVAQDPTLADEETAYQIGLRGLLALGAGAIAIAACVLLGYPAPVLACTVISALGLVLATLGGVLEDVLQARQHFGTIALAALASGLILTAFSVLAVFLGGGVIAVALAYLSGPVMSFALLSILFASRRSPLRIAWSRSRYGALLKESRTLGAAFVFAAIRDRAESLVIPKLLGIEVFGYFAGGILLAERLVVIPANLACAFLPLVASRYLKVDATASKEASRLIVIGLAVCLPICLATSFFADPIARTLFRNSPALTASVLRITIWSLPLISLGWALGTCLQAASAHREVGVASALNTCISLPVSVGLTAWFGVTGACASFLIRPALGVWLVLPEFRKRFPIALRRMPLPRIALAAAAMMLTFWLATPSGHLSLLRACGGALLGGSVYALSLLTLRVITPADLLMLLRRE